MICKCGKTALYHVGNVGYCRDHYRDAQRAMTGYNREIAAKVTLGRILSNTFDGGGANMARGGAPCKIADERALSKLRGRGITSIAQFTPESEKRRQHESVKAKRQLPPRGRKRMYDPETRPNPDRKHPPRMKVFKEVKP
jgi:hypothetical protein